MLRVRRLLLPVLLLALLAAACGSTAPPAATVEGDEIGQDDLDDYIVEQAIVEPASRQDIARVLSEHIWIDVFERELRGRGVPVPTDDEYRQEAEGAEGEEGDGTAPVSDVVAPSQKIRPLIRLIAEDESGLSVDSPLEELAGLVEPDQLPVCARHVLVETEDEAVEVLERLEAGDDFAELATELSIDEQSAVEGGDLGCVPPGSFVPEFRDALIVLDDGEVSGVVQTQFGFHVLQREGVDLTGTTAESLFLAYAGELAIGLLREADVSVLERLGEWNPDAEPPQVVVRL